MELNYQNLDESIEGDVLWPGKDGANADFETARTDIWNVDSAGMPLVIVLCQSASDIAKSVLFAKKHEHPMCVHSAGAHSASAVVDDCLVIDLSRLRKVLVNPKERTVTVSGGATIGDVDDACKPHGLALPMGHVHHTGVAGMALNATSGVGYLSRTRGLTVSFLQSVTIIMHDGTIETIEKDHELFWGLQGAGANFGVAAEMVFNLSKVAPLNFSGDLVKFPKGEGPGKFLCCINSDKSREELILRSLNFSLDDKTPVECSSILVVTTNGGPIISRVVYAPQEKNADQTITQITEMAKEAFEPLASYGFSLSNTCKAMPYHDGTQKMAKFAPSSYYQRGSLLGSLPQNTLDDIVSRVSEMSMDCPVANMGTAILFQQLGGELSNMTSNQLPTAGIFREAKMWVIVVIEFPTGKADPDLRQRCIDWVRETHSIIEPFAIGGKNQKLNHTSETYGETYGPNTPRLIELKRKYDPDNVFHFNRNIPLS